MVLNLSCTLESPGKLLKTPRPRPHSRPIKSESLGISLGIGIFFKHSLEDSNVEAWKLFKQSYDVTNVCLRKIIEGRLEDGRMMDGWMMGR